MLLGVAGSALITGSFWQGRGSYALGTLISGVVLFVLATRRVRSVEVSTTGAKAELDPDAEESTRLAQGAQTTDTEPPAVAGRDDDGGERVAAARLALARRLASEMLLSPPSAGPLAGCKFHLFLYDHDADRLLPALEPENTDGSRGWAIGQGATGLAYQRESYELLTGADVAAETSGLTEDLQRRYADLELVAAMPVKSAGGRTIGVLTASSRDANSQAASDAGYDEHLKLAVLVSRVLVDLLHWYSDD